MNILNTETGEFALHVGDVRSWFAQQEIAAAIADEFEGELGPFASYAKTDAPECDPATHKAVQIAPVDVDGVLTQQWQIVELTAQELEQRESDRLAAEQAAKDAARIIVPRHKGLVALYRLKGVEESAIQAWIDAMQDPHERYEAGVYFRSADWHSDDHWVLRLAPMIGAETSEDLRGLFEYADAL